MGDTQPPKSLEEDCGWVSSAFMLYLDRLFAKGNVKSLETADLGHISERDRTDGLHKNFVVHFEEFKKNLKPDQALTSLWTPLMKTVGIGYFATGVFLFFISAALGFGPVLLLNRLVRYFDGETDETTVSLWVMVSLLFVFPMSSSVCLAHSNSITSHIGCQCRNILVDVIYRKSLVISPHTKLTQSTGRIITMFSDDTNQIRTFFYVVCNTILAPFQIAMCLYLIYGQVGAATFVGLGFSVVTAPITVFTFRLVNKWRMKKMTLTDLRVKLTNEVLAGVRVIKYYAWEDPIIAKINKIRLVELELLSKMGYLFQSTFSILMLGAPSLQVVSIFVTYILLGNDLDVATAFTTMTLFNIMTMPFVMLPFGLQNYAQCQVAMKRICQFILSAELEGYVESRSMKEDIVIEIEGASLCWTPVPIEEGEEDKGKHEKAYTTVQQSDKEATNSTVEPLNKTLNTLNNLQVSIKKGQLVGVVGTVGCGKSSLLAAILGEMHLKSGTVSVQKESSFAFCDQRPFVVNATLKDNILFHSEFDEGRFEKVIEVVCMEDDVKMLSHGVMTEIGERGITLSGGQKARVSLARAVYSDADIFLLDDPLSAVDAHVGEHLFNRCIKEHLHGKTRLLVTHHVRVLPQCDLIIILDEDGGIVVAGSYEEITHSGINIEKYIVERSEGNGEGEENGRLSEGKLGDADGLRSRGRTLSHHSRTSDAHSDMEGGESGNGGNNLMTKEEKNDGAVGSDTYWQYMIYGGFKMFVSAGIIQLVAQACQLSSSFWLIHWGETTSADYRDHGDEMPRDESFDFLAVYAALVLGTLVLWVVARLALTYHRTKAAEVFHTLLLSKVLYFPVSFFDTTPVGRVINRFSHDMATVDELLAQSLTQVVTMGANVLTSLTAIVAATKGLFVLLIAPLAYLYVKFNVYFNKSHTAIARLEAISKSPIYADFSESLSGTSTIRAYKRQEVFSCRLEAMTDMNTVPAMLQQLSLQWLSIRLDFIGAVILFFMAALTLALDPYDFIPAGYLALGLSYAIALTTVLKMVVRMMAQLEAHFSSVERLRNYIEKDYGVDGTKAEVSASNPLDSAAADSIVKKTGGHGYSVEGEVEMASPGVNLSLITPPQDWPSLGKIEFRNVYMRYRDCKECVLKDVSFTVNSLAKLGICGRTGCGKSSLIVALFRIEELDSGQILIDDVDISRVPVHFLRSKLGMIPQDPVLFSSSLRFNLDPFNECSDERIWEVLRDVNMDDYVNSSLPLKLEEQVSEGGDNFSAGQRQLICIGRAILREAKILIMDEATASIDLETDAMIQKMIRIKFTQCTVLTIAHRLNTIIDSTHILVMNDGLKDEFDSPEALLLNPAGSFRSLWDAHQKSSGDGGQVRKVE